MRHAIVCRRQAAGFSLLEVLVALVIFSLGALALLRLQATAVRMSTDARQRTEAAFLADQLVARILVSDPATVADMSHRPVGDAPCTPSGARSTHPAIVDWLQQVQAAFPRATVDEQQVTVTGTPPSILTVRLCWRSKEGGPAHSTTVVNQVQWP